MPQLINTRNNPEKSETFNPNVDNRQKNATASGGAKFAWYICFIFIIPIFIHIAKRNYLISTQTKVNELTSDIDVQLKKRRDTLIKLVDSTKSYMKYEKSLLTDVTKLRKMNLSNAAKADDKMTKMFGSIVAVGENYPQLKTDTAVNELMEEAAYLEREIAASRRLYNSEVNRFNTNLFTFPNNVVASSMQLSTMPYFESSAEDKKDVSLKIDV